MNPVLMIAYNNLALTQKAIEGVLAQDIPMTCILWTTALRRYMELG